MVKILFLRQKINWLQYPCCSSIFLCVYFLLFLDIKITFFSFINTFGVLCCAAFVWKILNSSKKFCDGYISWSILGGRLWWNAMESFVLIHRPSKNMQFSFLHPPYWKVSTHWYMYILLNLQGFHMYFLNNLYQSDIRYTNIFFQVNKR